jgi:diacylglycerol kinase family enzyme
METNTAPEYPWKRVIVVLNRAAGTCRRESPEKIKADLEQAFADMGAEAIVRLTAPEDIAAAIEKARDEPGDLLIIGGGDGTMASAAPLLAGHSRPVALLPMGTFNLAARDLGMPLDWRETAAALKDAPVADMDLLDVNGQLHLCVVILGLYPAVAVRQAPYHGVWFVRAWRNAVQAMRIAAQFPPLELTLKNDSGQAVYRTRVALIANNDYEDLFGIIPRRRSLNAGYFTVYISRHRSRWGLLKSFFAWILGRWKQDSELTVIQATELEIAVRRRHSLVAMCDGDPRRLEVPLRVIIRPGALRVLAPRLAETTEKGAAKVNEGAISDAPPPVAASETRLRQE